MDSFGVVCAHAGMERIANAPAVETAADFRNCRLDLVFMVKSPELSDGPSFLKCLRDVQQAICWAGILSNRLLNAPMYSATEGRRHTLPVFVFLYEVSFGGRVSTSAPVSVMVLFRKLGLTFVLLACHSVAFSQTHETQIEPISSALRA